MAHEQGIPAWLVDLWVANHVAADGVTPIPPGDRLLRDGEVIATRAGDWVVARGTRSLRRAADAARRRRRRRLISADVALRVRAAVRRVAAPARRVRRSPAVDRPRRGRWRRPCSSRATGARSRTWRATSPSRATPPSRCATRCARCWRTGRRRRTTSSTATPRRRRASTTSSSRCRRSSRVLDHLELAGEVRSHHGDDGVRLVEKA